MNYRTGCFELFGFDIILDDQLVPHLLEVRNNQMYNDLVLTCLSVSPQVNVSPSLMGGSPLDVKIKVIT